MTAALLALPLLLAIGAVLWRGRARRERRRHGRKPTTSNSWFI